MHVNISLVLVVNSVCLRKKNAKVIYMHGKTNSTPTVYAMLSLFETFLFRLLIYACILWALNCISVPFEVKNKKHNCNIRIDWVKIIGAFNYS